jgi:hypothetical protein
VRRKTTSPPAHVGQGKAARIAGIGNAAVLRLALTGQLSYQLSPDGRPLFPVKELERLRARLAETARQPQPMGG